MKKLLRWLAVCVFAVLVFVPGIAQAQTVPTTITSFKVTDKNKQDLTSAFTNQDIYLTASWQAQGEVHEGDTFSLGIPDILDFPATNAASFNIYAPDGEVMATAQVTPGRVTITYTAWVNGKDNVQGTLWLAAHVKADAAAGTTTLKLVDEATGQVVETSFETQHYGIIQHEIIAKWGVKTDHNTVEWSVRLNHAADNLTNVVLEDTAQEGIHITHCLLYRSCNLFRCNAADGRLMLMVTEAEDRARLEKMTMKEIKAVAKDEGISLGYDGARKANAVDTIISWRRFNGCYMKRY